MSSLYYSGDTGTNRGTSLRRPGDARRRAQIRSDVLRQAAEDLVNEQAQVVTNCDAWTVFSFPLLLFIVCTITVGHVTDDLYFRT
jgi:hypothetical protein